MQKSPREVNRNTQRFSTPESISARNKYGIRHLVGKASDCGQKREQNEDSLALVEFTQILQSVTYPLGLYLLSDGLGGYAGGEIASRLAVTSVTRHLLQSLLAENAINLNDPIPQPSFLTLLENAVFAANDHICQQAQLMQNEMGATITAALVVGQNCYLISIGDCRAYHFNKRNGLQLITHDHSLVFSFYLMGHLKFEEIHDHPQRGQILRSLGEAGLRESLLEMMEKANHAYSYQLTLGVGDALLLCSDGLWQTVRDREIEKILATNAHPQQMCEELVDSANRTGGEDNISAIILRVE